MNQENYHISIEVRDAEGKLFKTTEGFKITSIDYQQLGTKETIETHMKRVGRQFDGITQFKCQIEVQASVANSISGTWMTMYSFRLSPGYSPVFVTH